MKRSFEELKEAQPSLLATLCRLINHAKGTYTWLRAMYVVQWAFPKSPVGEPLALGYDAAIDVVAARVEHAVQVLISVSLGGCRQHRRSLQLQRLADERVCKRSRTSSS